MKFYKSTTRILIAASLLLSFNLAVVLPGTSYANSNTEQNHKQTSKKNSSKSKRKSAKEATKTVTESVTIPFATQNRNDSSLAQGQTRVVQAGQNGKETRTYKVTYKNGKKSKKTLVSKKVSLAPVAQIVSIGTYVAPAPAPTPEPAPEPSVSAADSSGATARCVDGSLSYAAHHQGACSHHGGVAEFYR